MGPAPYPTAPLVSYQINRQPSGWHLPPLVFRAVGAHCLLWALDLTETETSDFRHMGQYQFEEITATFGPWDNVLWGCPAFRPGAT